MMYRSLFLYELIAIVLGASFFITSQSYAQVNEQRKSIVVDEKIRDIDGVAAVVNTGFITRKEIDDRVAVLKAKDSKSSDAPDVRKRV